MTFSIRFATGLLALGLALTACGSDDDATVEAADAAESGDVITDSADEVTDDSADESTTDTDDASASGEEQSFRIDIWADNWMAVYVDGELIGEDSVSITTERSFNAEAFTFEAAYPFTLAVETKDYKETDSGLEYIGENNQQMGDGGLIAQVTNTDTGEIVATTDSSWSALVVHRAPLNTDCAGDADPDATCEFEITDTPDGWTGTDFDDSAWSTATEWSEEAVSPRLGYEEIDWDSAAQLIWGSDLQVDNTILLRTTVG